MMAFLRKFLNIIPFLNMFPVDVTVFAKRGKEYVTFKDKARRCVRNDKSYFYELVFRGELKAPRLYDLTPDGKLMLFEKEYGTYVPVKFNSETELLEAIDIDDREFMINEMRRSAYKYKNPRNLTNILQMALPIIIILAMVIGGIMLYKQMSDSNTIIAEQNSQMLKLQAEFVNNIKGLGIDNAYVETNTSQNYTW